MTSWQDRVRTTLYPVYQQAPAPVKKLFRFGSGVVNSPLLSARQKWIRDSYTAFQHDDRRRLFMGIAQFAHTNRPIDGYYMEFGSHEANTMRMAWDSFHHLLDWSYIAFDSFEGLPKIDTIDEQDVWEEGKLKTEERRFTEICVRHGIPRDRLRTVKGFYDASLTPALKTELLPTRAAVIYVDCDLYASTVPVLEFCKDFLQTGTIIVFDDWNCFHGDPDRGERRAWREFRERHPALRFEPFIGNSMQQAFICIHPGDGEAAVDNAVGDAR
ncbi:TylF/MycF/NovP-related O-methyltransferase [Roseospira navarrensis]|uniref:Methyltransferase n=1 Tax=Roseospira navarrensis TaxID=140058 RepID=A0A7X2D583_9PROT|nr:TylF/MycF/NovP-related O-methyltransferase [Roseospira navarrensis]MQX37417.1 hypothetical protein [Roseospira navarrensis]